MVVLGNMSGGFGFLARVVTDFVGVTYPTARGFVGLVKV